MIRLHELYLLPLKLESHGKPRFATRLDRGKLVHVLLRLQRSCQLFIGHAVQRLCPTQRRNHHPQLSLHRPRPGALSLSYGSQAGTLS